MFCEHFIDIFRSSFGGNFMKISLTFYPTYFTEFFFPWIFYKDYVHILKGFSRTF